MFFQISPVTKPKTQAQIVADVDDVSIVSLGPFAPKPKVFFEDVRLGATVTKKIYIKNPLRQDVELFFTCIPPDERNVTFSWSECMVPVDDQVLLEITWTPIKVGAWCDTVTLEDGRKIKKDVSVVFKSITTKKAPARRKRVNPTKSPDKKRKVSPKISQKLSPKVSKALSPKYSKKLSPKVLKLSPKVFKIKSDRSPLTFKVKSPKTLKSNSPKTLKSNSPKLLKSLKFNSPLGLKSPKFLLPNLVRSPLKCNVIESNANRANVRNHGKENLADSSADNASFASSTFNLDTHLIKPTFNYDLLPKIGTPKRNESTDFEDSLEKLSDKDNVCKMLANLKYTPATPDISSKLKSLELSELRTPTGFFDKFNPSLCSTGQKSHSNSANSIELIKNLSSETYIKGNNSYETYVKDDTYLKEDVKGNISSGTYVKDNISGETFIKANISSGTYVKDDSVGNLATLSPTVENAAARNVILSPDYTKNINTWNLNKNGPLEIISEESHISGESYEETPKKTVAVKKRTSNETYMVSPFKKPMTPLTASTRKSLPMMKVKQTKGLNLKQFKEYSQAGVKKETNVVVVHDPDSFLNNISNPYILTSTSDIDPFMSATLYYQPRWMDEQEFRFKKWLNAVLTPPEELHSDTAGQLIDVAKLWQECKKRQVDEPASKEDLSNKLSTKLLDSVRKNAFNLFKQQKIINVLSKCTLMVENKKLTIRVDKNVHLDLGLQYEIMSLFLCYNPIWLRIGLETVFGVKMTLHSNSDIVGLSTFVLEYFFKDSYLMKKYKTIYNNSYTEDIKKHILKKFLMFVFFLDQAKNEKIIPYDPCLFCKNARIKESKEILQKFSSEVLQAIGDISKYLRVVGYTLTHKQLYIHEFEYAVHNLGIDLRDGVRLTRVAEIILLRNDLTSRLRLPAISRLQKVHNVKIVFDSLSEANYMIINDITPKDIVDGHWEKTLSFLWQIIYKFQGPRFVKAVVTVQNWWNSLEIVVKRKRLQKLREQKVRAAVTIQKWFKRQRLIALIKKFAPLLALHLKNVKLNRAAIKIQSIYRMYIIRKKYLELRRSVIHIQSFARKWLTVFKLQQKLYSIILIQKTVRGFLVRNEYLNKKQAVFFVEQTYLAKKLMRIERTNYLRLRLAAIRVQSKFRANKLMQFEQSEFLNLKQATITLQTSYRAKRLMETARMNFVNLKTAAVTIQKRFRANKLAQKTKSEYVRLTETVCKLQTLFRANREMKFQRNRYLELRCAAIIIQKSFRSNRTTRSQRENYLEMKIAAVTIQKWYRNQKQRRSVRLAQTELKLKREQMAVRIQTVYRMYVQRKRYREMQLAATKLQSYVRRFAAVKSFKTQKAAAVVLQKNVKRFLENRKFSRLKRATIHVQRKYLAQIRMRRDLKHYQDLKSAVGLIQVRYRANKEMVVQKRSYTELKLAAVVIQRRYRAKREMKNRKENFQAIKQSVVLIQRRFRANLAMRHERKTYLELRNKTIFIQKMFRAKRTMVSQRERMNRAASTIQKWYKDLKEKRLNQEKRQSCAVAIQKNVRRYLSRKKYLEVRNATVSIQNKWRANKRMQIQRNLYNRLKHYTIFTQKLFRLNRETRVERAKFASLKRAVILIQNRFRERQVYLKMKRAIIKIENCYITYKKKQMKEDAETFKLNVVSKLQRIARGYLTRQRYTYMRDDVLLQKRKKDINATLKIQSLWRGYCTRKNQSAQLQMIRKRSKAANEKKQPEKTLAYRRDQAIVVLISDNATVLQIIRALDDIDYVTRRDKKTCLDMSTKLPAQLYEIIISASRSLPEMNACISACSTLLNFVKYRKSNDFAWIPSYMDTIITMMVHWCDKEGQLFPYLCTLIWLFAQRKERRQHLLGLPTLVQQMNKIKWLCERKQRMVSKGSFKGQSVFATFTKLPSPMLGPDWGLEYIDRPRTFVNSIHALNSLLTILNIN